MEAWGGCTVKKYLEEQICICKHMVEVYSNQSDRHSQDLWYYWYGCLQANQKVLAFLASQPSAVESSSLL